MNEFIKYFDQVSIINLPYRMDRQAEMRVDLARVSMSLDMRHVSFFEACRPNDKGKFPNIGARGCFMSHLGVLKQAKAQGVDRLLVMEDDLSIDSEWALKSAAMIRELDATEWDIVYFGHVLSEKESDSFFNFYDENIQLTHFFAVHSRIFPKLIQFLELVASREAGDPNGGPMHVDGAYSTFRQQNKEIKTLVATPSLGWQRASKTDIHTLKWFDKLPVVKGAVAKLRKIKNLLN